MGLKLELPFWSFLIYVLLFELLSISQAAEQIIRRSAGLTCLSFRTKVLSRSHNRKCVFAMKLKCCFSAVS